MRKARALQPFWTFLIHGMVKEGEILGVPEVWYWALDIYIREGLVEEVQEGEVDHKPPTKYSMEA